MSKNILSIVALTSLLFSNTALSSVVSTSSMKRDVRCMAANIYHESRGESIRGQKAVASVTMNRVRASNYPNSVCNVVFQKSQFSWTKRKSIPSKVPVHIYQLAKSYVNNYNRNMDVTKGATFFHSVKSRPSWSNRLQRVTRIDNHIFYKNPKTKS